MRKKPRCFVAIAFEHSDTDKIYKKAILPTLQKNKIITIIINQRETNNDINNEIIEQLEKCDFCIADLTYARPSVYFEAGFAQRNVEVIYTARADHFKKNQKDGLEIHSNLKMKNIIKWKDENDKKFTKKLEKRLKNTVLKKFKREQTLKQKVQNKKKDFQFLPIQGQLLKAKKLALSIYFDQDYLWRFKKKIAQYPTYGEAMHEEKFYKQPSRFASKANVFIGQKVTHKKNYILTITVLINFTKRNLQILPTLFGSQGLIRTLPLIKNMKTNCNRVNELKEKHLFITLKKITKSQIRNLFPFAHWRENPERLSFQENCERNNLLAGEKKKTILRKVDLLFLSNINSEDAIVDWLKKTKSID